MDKQGITFTIEALFGLTLCILLLLLATVYLSHRPGTDTAMLSQLSLDTLAVLDHSGALQYAIQNNSAASLQLYLDSLPSAYCINLSLFTLQNTTLLSASRGSCSWEQKVIANRVFVASDGVYYAHLEGWWNYE